MSTMLAANINLPLDGSSQGREQGPLRAEAARPATPGRDEDEMHDCTIVA